ncbi:Utp14 protein-domain-containing protein [Powellomyces hirtus]|nr:Utp14 protein-domain-containing protein [Powellomyces hirtus]
MVDRKQGRSSTRVGGAQRPAKQRRVGNASSSSFTNNKVPGGHSAKQGGTIGLAAGTTLRPMSKRKAKRTGHDVYEASDDEEHERRILARRGGGGGGGQSLDDVDNYEYHVDTINEEDDEEIDEDEAFGDSDEEKYGAFFKDPDESGSRQLGDDDEDDEEEDEDDDIDGEDYMDMSDMLGSKEPESIGRKKDDTAYRSLLPHQAEDNDFVDHLEEQFESDDEESGDDERLTLDAEDGDDDHVAEQLSSYVFALDGKGRKKRKRAVDRTEVYDESEYNLAARVQEDDEDEVPLARKKIGLDALLGSIGEQTGFGGLKKQVAALSKAKGKTDTVDAPLPKRIQDRLERQAAYEESKTEISKWQPLVKKNREAGHLKFPMNEPAAINLSSGALVGKFEASTSMESEINKILREGALLEKNQAKMEELELNKISKEELLERRAELAKMRSLLFFKEQKQKKVAKIKSKAYRKLHKTDKDTAGDLSLEELKRLDPDMAREEIEKRESARARARMSQKHNSKDKWTKKMLGKNNDETHQAQLEKVTRGQELRRAVTGRDTDESDDGYESDTAAGSGDDLAGARSALDGVSKEIDDAYDEAVGEKGVFAMKFMQRGAARAKKEAQAAVQRARDGLDDDYQSDGGDSGAEVADGEGGAIVAGNPGRRAFNGKPSSKSAHPDYHDDESEIDDADGYSVRVPKPIQIHKSDPAASLPNVFPTVSFHIEEGVADFSFVGNANRQGLDDIQNSSVAAVTSTPPTVPAPHSTFSTKHSNRYHDSVADEEEVDADSSDESAAATSSLKKSSRSRKAAIESSDVNPWLAGGEEVKAVKKSLSTSGTMSGAKIGKAEKAMEKLAQQKKSARRAEHSAAVRDVELNLDGVRALETTSNSAGVVEPATTNTEEARKASDNTKKNAKKNDVTYPNPPPTYASSDSDSDFESPATNMVHISSVKQHLTQRDIMAMAFANDDVAADFEEEKAAMEERDAPKDKDLTLPGWGSWGGIGIQKKVNKVVQKARPGQGIDVEKRMDRKLKHVIINEKRMKKAVKYTASQVPHGFDNKEQYERTIRAPLGREWNAAGAHNDMIKPRVQKKLGVVIAPLKFTGSSGGKKGGKGVKPKK